MDNIGKVCVGKVCMHEGVVVAIDHDYWLGRPCAPLGTSFPLSFRPWKSTTSNTTKSR